MTDTEYQTTLETKAKELIENTKNKLDGFTGTLEDWERVDSVLEDAWLRAPQYSLFGIQCLIEKGEIAEVQVIEEAQEMVEKIIATL